MKENDRAKQLAGEHWDYIGALLKVTGVPDVESERIGFHYRSALIHGFKHGAEFERGLGDSGFCAYTPEPDFTDKPVSLCESCVKAGVSCPIHSQETYTCVAYANKHIQELKSAAGMIRPNEAAHE